jgi:hypothetical protein
LDLNAMAAEKQIGLHAVLHKGVGITGGHWLAPIVQRSIAFVAQVNGEGRGHF